MSSSNPKPPATSARALFRQSKLAATAASPSTSSSAVAPASRIHHPFAAYDAHSRLKCTLCNTLIKSVAGWKPHLASPEHKATIAARQHAATNPAVKRTANESGLDRGTHGAPLAKVAKTSASASPVSVGRTSSAAAAALAAYASSDEDEVEQAGDKQQQHGADQDSDSDAGGALPAGFFDNNDDSDGSDSDSDSEPTPNARPMRVVVNNTDDADLLAYDIADNPTSPANLASAIFDSQGDDDVEDTANGHVTQPPPPPPLAQQQDDGDQDPDAALFAGLISDRADAEIRAQSELVERLRRLRTERGQLASDDDQSASESSDDDAQQPGKQPSASASGVVRTMTRVMRKTRRRRIGAGAFADCNGRNGR